MGTEVKAFPGPAEVMNRWKERLPPMVVFLLTPELALVPATEDLLRELGTARAASDG